MRLTAAVSGVALYLIVAIVGVGLANTTARTLTVVELDSARFTVDFIVMGL